MRVTASRLDSGQPLRDAMKAAGLNRVTLAERTKQIDADGLGVSQQLIAFVATDRKWGRETISVPSAVLIARALDKQESELFAMPASFVPTSSTYN